MRAAFFLLFLLPSFLLAAPRSFTIKDLGTRNLFVMQLDGPLEKNIAVSRFIAGSLLFDAEKNNELSGNWEIDLRSLDTQNEMRNLEWREKTLKTAENPILRVQLPPLSIEPLQDEKIFTLKTNLIYQYAGKSITKKSQLKITYYKESKKSQQRLPGNLLRLQVKDDWNLEQYGLGIVETLRMIFPASFSTETDLVASDALPTDKPLFPEAPKPK